VKKWAFLRTFWLIVASKHFEATSKETKNTDKQQQINWQRIPFKTDALNINDYALNINNFEG
jgi:hypothetical protein